MCGKDSKITVGYVKNKSQCSGKAVNQLAD